MITSSRERGLKAKQESGANNNENNNKLFKAAAAAAAAAASTSSSRQWSAFRNPRIVRVSRSFGGKDRHSKVCTIRGLRDRRIRLSVPTAIQLYDLQDRLGLSQPSKVIDWLLDATKHDIDNLPPLQLPQGFGQFHPQMLLNNSHDSSSLSPFLDANLSFKDVGGFHHHGSEDHNTTARSKFNWEEAAEAEASLRGTNQVGISINNNNKGKLIKTNDQENQVDGLSAQRLFPLASASHSSLPSLLNNNNPLQFNPYNYHWDASNLSLSQFGILPQPENSSLSLNTNNTCTVSLPSSLAFSSAAGGGGSQFFFCPPATMPSLFPQYPPFAAAAAAATTPLENNESREISHFQLLTSGFAHSQRNNNGRQPDKDHHNADS